MLEFIELAASSGVSPSTVLVCAVVVWTINSDKRTENVVKILRAVARITGRRK